jgi:hypothetical protein
MDFLLILRAYAGPTAVGSVANIAAAIAFRTAFSRAALGSQSRLAVCLLAGAVGGALGVGESLVVVEVLGFRKEAAGFALVLVPVLLTPTAVGALAWVLDDSYPTRGKRSG